MDVCGSQTRGLQNRLPRIFEWSIAAATLPASPSPLLTDRVIISGNEGPPATTRTRDPLTCRRRGRRRYHVSEGPGSARHAGLSSCLTAQGRQHSSGRRDVEKRLLRRWRRQGRQTGSLPAALASSRLTEGSAPKSAEQILGHAKPSTSHAYGTLGCATD